jgi:hypothetical protein
VAVRWNPTDALGARASKWRRDRFNFNYDALSYALNFDDGGASADFMP